MDDEIQELYDALNRSHYTLAITGAGISIAAGGVTYAGMANRSSGRGMRSDDPNELYQTYYNTFLGSMFEHGPTKAHKSLATLEKMGLMQGIITTNVDCMHTMAGSKNVAEIQGSFQVNVCPNCGHYMMGYEMWNHGHLPTCENCGSYLQPYNMYSHAGLLMSDLTRAQDWMKKADLILVIGATGCYTHMYWRYQKRNVKIIQINPGSTYFDREAYLNIRDGSDPVFEKLMKLF